MNQVREIREHAGLTQEAVAQKTGLSVSTVQKIEAGAKMREVTLVALANLFGCSADEILGRTKAVK